MNKGIQIAGIAIGQSQFEQFNPQLSGNWSNWTGIAAAGHINSKRRRAAGARKARKC
jgi:hypothetical protein